MRHGSPASQRRCARTTRAHTSASSATKASSGSTTPTRARPGTGSARSSAVTTRRTCSGSTRTSLRRPAAPDQPDTATEVAYPSPDPAGQYVRDVVLHRSVELGVATRGRLAVRTPAHELGDVPEPESLHVVVADLDYPLGPEWDEGQLLVRVPPAGLSAACGARTLRPAPWMTGEVGDQRLQLGEQLSAADHRERAHHPDGYQERRVGFGTELERQGRTLAVVDVQSEQHRADRTLAGLVHPVTRHDAVCGPLVLDLDHDPLVRLIGQVRVLRDQSVQACTLEQVEPSSGHVDVPGDRGDVDRRDGRSKGTLERGTPLVERPRRPVHVIERQQVEGDEGGRGLG